MSEPNPAATAADQQRRYKELLDLLPLAITLAGLPRSEGTRYYSEEQMELRSNTVRHAFTFARQLARDHIQRQ